MPIVLLVIVVLLFVLTVLGFAIFLHTRKLYREQKNFERGLKMVPLLIHLPPRSSDTEVGSRDTRDVVDETISKAETLYDIIASTAQKGFKNRFYGQRHFAFEIVAVKGLVHFYTAVPVPLLEVVEQAILSAYPTARLEEASEHNIFSPTGKTSSTMGGELVLKEHYSQPIATFQEMKRDSMQSLLNALSTLDKEDGAGIQILMRPADQQWRKDALGLAQKKRKNEEESTKTVKIGGWWVSQLAYALFKPPEDKSKEKEKKEGKPLSGIDQALVDGIEEKTRHAGYEVLIRVVSSSSTPQKAQSIYNSIVATFALFDSPGKNGFKVATAKDIDSFVTSYIMRFFPPENNESILNSIELATIFHFPDQNSIPTTQLSRQRSKQVDGPRNIPEDGLVLGYNIFKGNKKKIVLSPDDRRRHVYFVGQTGVGKTTFLQNLALQDMMNGDGFCFIDPHGDVASELLSIVPKERTEDVIYFCPSDTDYPLGLNMFEFDPARPEQKDFLIQESLNMLYKLYDPQKQGIIGPRFERIFTNCALLLMADPKGGTFVDIPKLLIDADFMKGKLKYVTDQNVLDFWTKEWPNSQKSNEAGEVTSWVVSKFGAFLSNEMMRNIIGQTKSSFNLREIMDNRKILIVNLSKGQTGSLNSKLLGMIFVMKFQAAAMSRADVDRSQRPDFCLYVDEFQNYSTDSFADIMSEARKFGLNLIVANQFTTQLSDEVKDAVFGNIGTVIALRVGVEDAEFLARQFAPSFDGDDLQRIPNGNAAVRTMIHGVPTQPFSMAGLPPLDVDNKDLEDALKQLSAAKYGRPKAIVDKEITSRISVKKKPGQGPQQRPPQPKGQPGSFLDDWVQKKATNSFRAPSSPFGNRQGPPPPPQQTTQPAQPGALSPAPAPQPQQFQQQQTAATPVAPQVNTSPVQAAPVAPAPQPQQATVQNIAPAAPQPAHHIDVNQGPHPGVSVPVGHTPQQMQQTTAQQAQAPVVGDTAHKDLNMDGVLHAQNAQGASEQTVQLRS